MLLHDFLAASQIPKLLPVSTLVQAPSDAFSLPFALPDFAKLNMLSPAPKSGNKMQMRSPGFKTDSQQENGCILGGSANTPTPIKFGTAGAPIISEFDLMSGNKKEPYNLLGKVDLQTKSLKSLVSPQSCKAKNIYKPVVKTPT
jgi:hypothetical protein